MKVERLSRTVDGLETIYTACKTCVSDLPPSVIFEDVFDNIEPSKNTLINLVKKVIESGHHSVLEHYSFTFSINGISRACTHQLVRHRHMSFSQKSQRYVKETEQFEYVVPKSYEYKLVEKFGEHLSLEQRFNNLMKEIQYFYDEAIKCGVPPEDARFVLPNAATSSMVASLNLRELIHLANLRLCTNAQWEIRELVSKMCDLVIEKEPWLKEYLQPKCEALGYCNEIKCCGRKKKREEVIK